MPNVRANGIQLEYEAFGDPSHPALLLIMGFRMQLLSWHEELCAQLAAQRFYVIRFDNRDVGLSSKIEGGPKPDLAAALRGDPASASYSLDDMADDAAGLLDALGLPAAHVVGMSMGGMIGQLLALRHPRKVLSLCSIMSTTGDRAVGQTAHVAMGVLLTKFPTSREGFIERTVETFRVIGSPGFPFDEAEVRLRAGLSYDRCFYPVGAARQLIAILTAPDRTAALGSLQLPTVVIHGTEDPLVAPSGGEATARAIPGARLMLVPGMGHDLPKQVWPLLIDAIAGNAARAPAPAR